MDGLNENDNKPLSVWEATEEAEKHYGIPTGLLRGLGMEESFGLNHWDENGNLIKSGTGPTGVFQFTKKTARAYGVNRENAMENIAGAGALLRDNYKALRPKIKDEREAWMAAAVAHNRGLGAVESMIRDGEFFPSGKDSGNGGDTYTYATKIANNWADIRDKAGVKGLPSQSGTRIPDYTETNYKIGKPLEPLYSSAAESGILSENKIPLENAGLGASENQVPNVIQPKTELPALQLKTDPLDPKIETLGGIPNNPFPENIQSLPVTVADFDPNQAFMFGDPNAQADQPGGANAAQLAQNPDSEYLKYLKYTKKTDSPQTFKEYQNLLKSDFGQNVEVAADVNSPNPVIPQETFPQDAAVVLQNESNTNRIVRNDADMLGAQAARVAVDLSKAPQGMDKNEFAIRASMKAIAADYGLTDADIERAVGIMKGTDGTLLKQGDVNERNDVINVRVPFGNIVAALGGTAQNIPDIVRKKFGELQGDRQLRLATSEQPLEKDAFGNPVLARDVLNQENQTLRKNDDDLLREEAIRNMMASPLVIHDEEGIQNEIERIRKMRFDRSDKEEIESFAEGTKNFGNGGSFVSGLVGGAGRSVSTIAGIMRPFEELGVLPENWYTSVAKYGKKLQAGDEEYAKRNPDGSTVLRVTGGALSDIPRLIVMSELPGGAVVGFAADSGLQSAGRGESVEKIAGQTAKGAMIGAIFGAASKLGKMAESGALRAFVNPVFDAGKTASPAERLVSKVFGEGVKIGTIGSGTFTVERISGATNEEALNAAIGNALFDFVTTHGGGVVKGLAGLSGKIIRNWKNGKPVDVTVKADGTVERLPQLADKNLVDIEMILDPLDGVYKQKADYAEYQNFGKENGTAQPVNNKAPETGNIPSNFERLDTSVPPRELAEQNPSRIDVPMPDAVQRASIDTRAQRIVENLKGKDAVSVEELAKLTKFNKKNLEDAVMLLYGARQVEILPDNRIRFIGGENSAVQPKSIFERAQEANKTGDLGLQQNQNRGGNSGGSNVVLPSPSAPLETRAESFNAQMQKSETSVKAPSKIEFAEPPDIAQKLNVFTERGTKAQAAPMVVDSSELLTSLDADYPMELQPRDRSRMASKAQITTIANKLNPEFLGDSPKASDGRPLVVPVRVGGVTKYAVVSGNGRSEAIRQAYDLGKGEGYRAFVQTKTDEDRKNLQKPVYVGVLNPNEIADLSEFAKEANESATAQMSATEQARSDAERLDGGILNLFQPSDDGTIHSAANRDFTRAFLERAVPVSEQNRLVDGNGALNQDGLNRVKNAIFAAAFGDSEKGLSAIQRMSESTDNNVKNITAGLLASSGGIVRLKNDIAGGKRHAEFDISNDLATAMEKYAALRENSISMDEYISQGNLFGAETSPFQTRVMQVFDQHKRSPKAIRTIITNFLDIADAVGDPNQQNLFGEKTQIDVKSAFEAAVENYERENRSDNESQTELFGDQGLQLRRESETDSSGTAQQISGEQTTGNAVAESGSLSLAEAKPRKSQAPEEEPPRKFASTQLDVPEPLASQVLDYAKKIIPKSELAEDGFEEDQHITAFFGLETNDPAEVKKVIGDFPSFKVRLGKIEIFDTNPDFDVVKIAVSSEKLNELNKLIGQLPNGNEHPVFKAHETLAYVKKGEGAKYVGDDRFEGVEIPFTELVFSSKDRRKIKIPLTDGTVNAPNNSDSDVGQSKSGDAFAAKQFNPSEKQIETKQVSPQPLQVGDAVLVNRLIEGTIIKIEQPQFGRERGQTFYAVKKTSNGDTVVYPANEVQALPLPDAVNAPNNSDTDGGVKETNVSQFSAAVKSADVLPSSKSETQVKRMGLAAMMGARKSSEMLSNPRVSDDKILEKLYNNKGELDYGSVKDIARRIGSGELEITRLAPREEQGRNAGGRRNVEASLIAGAEARAMRGASSGSGQDRKARIEVNRKIEAQLEKYARHENFWFDYEDFTNKYPYLAKGEEARIFEAEDKAFVYKAVNYSYFDPKYSPLDFIDERISLFNYLFPETKYELIGFTRDSQGNFRFILKQPFIIKHKTPTPRKVSELMKSILGEDSQLTSEQFANREHHVSDLHLGNVIQDKHGNIFVIDALTELTPERLGGSGQYKDFDVKKSNNENATREKTQSEVDGFNSSSFEKELSSIQPVRNREGNLLAPNGKVSKLRDERLWKTVRTKSFKEWFGDWENVPETASKAVDENGEPLVAFHGTRETFDTFKISGLGGMFFTPNKLTASMIAGFAKNPMEVFLNLRDPKFIGTNKDNGLWEAGYDKQQILTAKQEGHDGIIFNDTDGNSGYLVTFEPNQIKSIFNEGSFAKENDSILKYKKSESYRKEEAALANRLYDLMDNSVSELGEKAKAVFNGKTQTLELNEEAATIISFALRQAGDAGDPFFGVYLAPDKADLVRANIFNFGKAVYRKGNLAASARLKKLMQEFDKAQANEFKDVSIAVKSELAPQVFEKAREEESAHRADFRVRNFERKDLEPFKQLDSYKKAVENVKKDYEGASERQLHNEVIAKMFRTDAEEVLGISSNEIKQIRKAYRKQLIKNSIPSEKFKKEFSNISKNADKAIQDYERLFRKTERNLGENVARGSEQPISSNESVREIRGEGRGYSPRPSDGKSRNFGIGFDDANRNSTQSLAPASAKDIAEVSKHIKDFETQYSKPTKTETEFWKKFVKNERETSYKDIITNFRRAGLLTGVRTHLKNMVSNALMQAGEEATRPIALLGDLVASAVTGKRTVGSVSVKGIAKSFAALVRADETMRTLNQESGIARAWNILLNGDVKELKKNQLNEMRSGFPVFDMLVNGVFRLLGAEDALFKTYAVRRSLEEQAHTRAVTESREKLSKFNNPLDRQKFIRERRKELLADPTKEMLLEAMLYADFVTFTNDNPISDVFKKVKDADPKLKFVLEMIVPYDKTPTNVILRTLEYTPAGFIAAGKHLGNLKKGESYTFDRLRDDFMREYENLDGNRVAARIRLDKKIKEAIDKLNEDIKNANSVTQKLKLQKDLADLKNTRNLIKGKRKIKDAFREADRQNIERSLENLFPRIEQQMFARAFGRAGLGSAALALGIYLAMRGLLSGSLDSGRHDQREKFYARQAEGILNGSLVLGDRRYQINDTPLGKAMVLGASLWERSQTEPNDDQSETTKNVSDVVDVGSDLLFEQPLLNSLNDYFGSKKPLEKRIGGLLGSFVPTILADVADVTDDAARENKDLFDAAQNRIPGLREQNDEADNPREEYLQDRGNRIKEKFDPFKSRPVKDQ